MQYVILIIKFFPTKRSKRAIRAGRLRSPKMIRARTPMIGRLVTWYVGNTVIGSKVGR